MIVGLTGASGNMGLCVVEELIKCDFIEKIRILGHSKKGIKRIKKVAKRQLDKIEFFSGSISNPDYIDSFVNGVDYVINMAAVIPPLSDKRPDLAIQANEIGPKVLCESISKIKTNQPKLIHISTMGTYGDRNEKHLFGEVGDPLICSPFDIYSLTKVRGEFYVLESDVKTWAVIRQTAVLYDELMFKNISDGLMFHTCFNAPLEWVTAHDSAVLIKNILEKDRRNELNSKNFWLHTFNLGGGEINRVTGFETLDLGFKIIGASTYQFFDTNYNALRNFHGMWFSDGQKLEDLFHYQHDTIYDFWKSVLKKNPYFRLARILPKKWLKALIIKPLLKDSNAPFYWVANNDIARVDAYCGGIDKFNSIPKKWEDFPLLCHNNFPGVDIDYEELKKHPTYLEHGFDLHKNFEEVTIEDLKSVAKAHGGKLLTENFVKGDVYKKVLWENQDGVRFEARPYTILGCGHWYSISYEKYAWDYDRLAKKDKILAQIWYDAHEKDENKFYFYDENFDAKEETI